MTRPTTGGLEHDPASLKWARENAGMSLRGLARHLGIHSGHLSEMESGTRNCPTVLQARIAEQVKCPAEMLTARIARSAGPERGNCPVCHKEYALKSNGKLWRHVIKNAWPPQDCPGTNEKPE